MSKLNSACYGLALAASLCGSVGAVPLTSATISIDTYLTGGTGASQNTAVLATLALTKSGADVNFRLSNSLNNLAAGGNGFLTDLLFSYDQNPTITISNIGNFGGTQAVSGVSLGNINDAGYAFDIEFGYPTSGSPSSDRFVDGEFTTWTITGVTIEDFLTPDSGNTNGALALVHVQGLGTNGYSVKYTGDLDEGSTDPGGGELPEPGSLALVALGLLAGGWRTRQSGKRLSR
jgi:hypothetical protein